MAAGSRDRPPMLATGRYEQWKSRFLRYMNTRPNVETILNMSPENKAHYESEKEAIHLLLIGIGDEIYSTVNSCKTAHEMWITIERLQQDPYYQAPKPHRSLARPSKHSSSTRSNATTKYKGKEIAKPITPPSVSASDEDNDPKQAQRDKDKQKKLSLIAKTVTVVGAKESVGRQGKRLLVSQGNILLRKQVEKCVPLQAKQADWLADMDEEIDKQELEAHYNYMAKIQEAPTADS
uniref:Gag-Pol polyprotein n=1 Tax=Tanacetum cinerariifolium TaxID=118510 RepID=A0A6L2N2X5_TANCI|nr:hypothetical protein [Tanacetum cinerariifolium]